jgi:hypothetical protein
MASSIDSFEDSAAPLTIEEHKRLNTMLAAVSTQTLLRALARMAGEDTDAQLIIAAVLDRLPPETRHPSDEAQSYQ